MSKLTQYMSVATISRLIFGLCIVFGLSGCVGQVVDAAVDTTIAVAKVPFKVGGAVIDVVTGDDEEEE